MIPKRITSVEPGYPGWTFNYEYSGQLLTKMYEVGGVTITFSYNSNNKLQSMIASDGTETQNTTATYSSGNMTQLHTTSSDGGSANEKFYYNSLGQVNKYELYINGSLAETHFYVYDAIGNVIKDTENGVARYITVDNKNHPFKNVITQPEDGFIGNPWFGNLYNNYLSVDEYTFTYQYDSDNFPVKRVYRNGSGTIVQTDTFEY